MANLTHILRTGFCGIAALLTATSAHASFSGTLYYVQGSSISAPTLAGLSALTPANEAATFTSSALNFDSRLTPAGYTIDGFLNTVPGTTTGETFFNGASGLSPLDFSLGGKDFSSIFVIKGTALFATGSSFNISHDDGVNLYVGSTNVLSSAGPTSPNVDVVTIGANVGSASPQAFTFIYAETSGPPAVLKSNLVTTPEPGYLALVGLGMIGLVNLNRRRQRKS